MFNCGKQPYKNMYNLPEPKVKESTGDENNNLRSVSAKLWFFYQTKDKACAYSPMLVVCFRQDREVLWARALLTSAT